MASKTKKIKAIRNRKRRPNKANMKGTQQRIFKNLEVISKVVGAQ